MGSVVRITLDAETFKALASPTRLTVLRALDERRKTLTEISRDLSLNKATVHEHLQLLTAAQLVRKRDDEGRKWIYYELTWRGQKLMHPQETTTFSVLLGLGIAAAGGGVGMLAYALTQAANDSLSTAGNPEGAAKGAAPVSNGSGSQAPAAANQGAGASTVADSSTGTNLQAAPGHAHGGFFDEGGAIAVALLAAGLLFALLSWLLRRRIQPDRFRPSGVPEDNGEP
jgi:DNA-binding transcriptional ArsR family regulator